MTLRDRHVPSVFGLAAGGLLVLLAIAYIVASALTSAWMAEAASRAQVTSGYERIVRLQQLLSLLQDAEIGQRGYIITGDEAFLEPYQRCREAIDAAEEELRKPEWRARRDRIAPLLTLIDRKLAFTAESIAARRTGTEPAEAMVKSALGKRLMDAIRTELSAIEEAERSDLAAHFAAEQERTWQSRVTVFAALGIGFLIVLAVGSALVWHVQARKRVAAVARESTVLLRATLENVDHGIALLDDDGRLLAWNEQMSTLLGRDLAEGLPIRDAIADTPGWSDDPEEAIASRNAAALRLERELGLSGRCVEVRGQPAPEGTYALTYTDISERRRAERLKNDFISNVSHELRTPLTSIKGVTGLLLGTLRTGLPDRAVSLVEVADRNAGRLLALVNDLLDIDKIEAGKLEFDFAPTDLNLVALEAAEMNRAYAEQRRVALTLGREAYPVMVNADAARLQQVMANLISNAAKFAPADSIVTITVERRSHKALVIVRDEGEGVPEEFRSRIFGKFAQAASGVQRQSGGSGLGLSISRAIVERHGGEIGFASQPRDTRFYFSLPLLHAPHGDPAADLAPITSNPDRISA